ncbi:MAG TPA: cob(I)yrinic acid a,c-diamide adenosyltransferase [Bacteroidota bacterium]
MKIYTKTGDKGKTSLFGGERVSKDALRIEAYGSVDELNSQIGVIRSLMPPPDIDRLLQQLQQELFVLGTDLATPVSTKRKKVLRIEPRHSERLEREIDRLEASLEPLTQFILPGGSKTAAELHVARTICRRAERRIVQLSRKDEVGTSPVVYINRLSDFLFVAARYVNKVEGINETKWDSKKVT